MPGLTVKKQEVAGFIVECLSLFFIIGLATWTLFANAIVLLGGSFNVLYRFSPIVLVGILSLIGLAGWVWTRDKGGAIAPNPIPEKRRSRFDFILPLVIAIALVIVYGITDSNVIFWILSCSFLVYYYLRDRFQYRSILTLESPVSGNVLLLFALIAIAILTASIVFRYHDDDAFYLNLMVGALDFPDRPLLGGDTLHGIPDIPLLLPVYRIHAIELLNALLSKLTGISHLTLNSLIQPAIAAPFVVCASAVLLRVLTPRHWLTVTAVVTLLVVMFTARSAGLGNMSLGKLQHGKSLFVAIVVPLIVAYTVRCFADPRWWRWGLLGLVNIAAVGCTSTALYAAPLATALTLTGCVRPTWEHVKRAVLTLSAAFYPIALSLFFFVQIKQNSSPYVTNPDLEQIVDNNFVLQLDFGLGSYIFWIAILASWTILGDRSRRGLLLGIVTAFMLVFMNPWLQEFWAVNLTGVPTFRRLWWAIPRHVLVGLLLSFPLFEPRLARYRRRMAVVFGGTVAAGLAVFGIAAAPHAKSPQIGYNTSIDYRFPPQTKLPHDKLEIVSKAIAIVPPRSSILAPWELTRWFVIYRRHPYPVVVTQNYLNILINAFGREAVERRQYLVSYISGVYRPDNAPQLLRQSIAEIGIDAVLLPSYNTWNPEIRSILSSLGFESQPIENYELWYKTRDPV